jgi:hypothetical protein
MRRLKKYSLIFISVILIAGCDKPDPTILEPDPIENDQVEIEVLTSDTGSEISKGMDSTGTVEELTRFSNYIGVSGIKITDNSVTSNISIAQAIFFDRTIQFRDSNERLIGFLARALGEVRFNNEPANLIPLRIRIKDRIIPRDTSLGLQHLLYNGSGNHSDRFDFVYNSFIDFKFSPFLGFPVSFKIPTPPEITGNIIISRNHSSNKLQASVSWNSSPLKNIEIIIGVRKRNGNAIIPLYRIKTPDDGNLVIPAGLLNSIPRERFNKLVISLNRKYEGVNNTGENELFVRSQSIHSIIVDIP